jgi:hypothetical protein
MPVPRRTSQSASSVGQISCLSAAACLSSESGSFLSLIALSGRLLSLSTDRSAKNGEYSMKRGAVEQVAAGDRHPACRHWQGPASRRCRPPPARRPSEAFQGSRVYDPAPRFDAARLTTGPAARLLQTIVIVAALFILFAALRVPTETGAVLPSTATTYRPALAHHPRLNRAPPQGIPTCAGRSWGCAGFN